MPARTYQQLVFSGGGTRCFWHGGFLEATREPLQIQPERITGVSGGALSGACFIGECGKTLLENMGEAFLDVDSNLDFEGDEPGDQLTPHQAVYCQVVKKTLHGEVEQRVADGPQFQVLLAHPPARKHPKASTLPLTLAYWLDLRIRSTPELKFTKWAGLEQDLVDAREAARQGKLADLICNAAVIPPVFNLQGWNGKKVVDGGLACKAPMPTPDEGNTLVLLTRRFRNLPQDDRRVYVEVSRETPADKLDFTDREAIEATWELGRRDGLRFLDEGPS